MSAVHNGLLWVFGGDTSDVSPVPSDVWNSPDGLTWTRVAETSPWGPAYLAIATVFQGSLHVMGGTASPSQHYRSADGVTWERMPDMPFGRASIYGGVVNSGRLYLIGGQDGNTVQMHDTWAWNGAEWHQMSAAPAWSAREWVCTASYDGKLWCLTGKNGVANAGGIRYSEDCGATWVELPVYPWGPSHADSITVTEDGIILAAGNGTPGSVYFFKTMPADPSVTMATLPWTIWFDGAAYNPVTPTIFGKASAGTSASRALDPIGSPTQGEINGRPTIILDGVNDVLRYSAGTAVAEVISATAWTISFVGKINSSTSDSAAAYTAPGLGCDSNAYWSAAAVRSSGPLTAYQDDGGVKQSATTWTAGVLVLVQARFDGTQLQIRKGKGAWTTTAAGNIASVGGVFHIGANHNLLQVAGLEICEYAASNVAISDANLNLAADDMAAKWGVAV
jgi:hypothetical protein